MSPLPLCYLQTLPPISHAATLNCRPKPLLPAHDSTTGARGRTLYVACAERSNKTSTGSTDDYHSTLRALNSKGRFPRKSLGQHYMLNADINEQLAGAAGVEQGDVVLEIGPGTGSLTNVLLTSGAFVLAVEKDKHMAALVNERFSSTGKLKVVTEDIVKCHVRSHMSSWVGSLKQMDPETRNAKVVANIPFNISTDVIKLLLPMGDIFSEVVLLLQEETALRLVVSSLRTPEYRPINIFVNFYSDPEYKFKVPRTNFFPQPNVDAAVVSFKLKLPTEYPKVSSSKSFFSMVNSAFNEKRKMLRKSLQHICTSLEIEEALKSLGLLATLHSLIAKE
ncbi:ribosomal RNA small subunit methyltransferase, chloroplastic isoform X2 [Gastrolobium bilobum]|uniref:ribosomal RNA small subunit methyltransferase, chloroplastic isoform X2 n=1 Tax=Gastrolobium bilobum TaxID=150636 RepID=UPI002AB22A61|nr:ribosomal RNA small subunit methyltransferase, chloroplastic isoform X2 [Gastrolobium bilobum]